MEIARFLRLTPRRISMLLTAALVAALVAGIVSVQRGAKSRAEAVVFTSQVFSESVDGSSLGRRVADLETALKLPSVLDEVSSATGVPATDLRSDISFEKESDAASVRVSYTHEDADVAEDVVDAVVSEGLGLLLAQDREAAERAEARASADLAEAVERLETFQAATGSADVVGEVERRSNDILTLRNQIAAGGGAALRTLLTAKEQEFQRLVQQYAEYESLSANFRRASEDQQDAARADSAARAQEEALESPLVVVTPPASSLGLLSAALPSVLGAVVLVSLLLLAAFLLGDRSTAVVSPDVTDRRRIRGVQRKREPSDSQASGLAGAPSQVGPRTSRPPRTTPSAGAGHLDDPDAVLSDRSGV